MQRRFYTRLNEKVRDHRALCRWVVFLCRAAPWAVVAAFGVTFLVLLVSWNLKWIFFLLVPAVAVALVTLLRDLLDKPRPFERFVFTPLVRHGAGKSFPSRHTASAVAIAMACLYVNVWYGVGMLFLAAVIGVTRVLAGVHHIWDVVAGAAISVACALPGYYLLAPLLGL